MYEERTYRTKINEQRFQYFTVKNYETDLLIGISGVDNIKQVEESVHEHITSLRSKIESVIWNQPEFLSSYKPLESIENYDALPNEVRKLIDSSRIAGTGPMAGIAGLFSESAGEFIMERFSPDELIIENGGDIFADIKDEIVVSVFAGASPLSEKIGIVLPAGCWGVCTSSGTVGPSKNFGKSDAFTVVCKSATLADQLATGLSNEIFSVADMGKVLDKSTEIEDIIFTAIIIGDQLGIKGSLKINPL